MVRSVFARRVSGAGSLLNRAHRSAAAKPCASIQRATSHRGCDSVDRKIVEGRVTIARHAVCGERRARRKRQGRARAADPAQHRVHEPRRAALARLPRQLHRIVHDRGGGNAIEVQQLVDAEPQHVADFGVQSARAAASPRARSGDRWRRASAGCPSRARRAGRGRARRRRCVRACAIARRQIGSSASTACSTRSAATRAGAIMTSRVPAGCGRPARNSRAVIDALALGLQGEDAEHAVAGGHADRVAGRLDDRCPA